MSNHVPELPDIVDKLGFSTVIEACFTSALIGYEKPNIMAFQYVLEYLRHPNVCIMVGDSVTSDIKGASNAGIIPILLHTAPPDGAFNYCRTIDEIEGKIGCLMSNRISMTYTLVPQKLEDVYAFDRISTDDLDALAASMFEAFQDTADYEGESLEDLKKELSSVIEGTFGTFLPEASFKIKQNGEIAAAILISLYKDKPLLLELFTTKKYLHLGMASGLLKKSVNTLISLGYENLVLNVHPQNFGAISLYRKIGFAEL